MIHGDFVPTTVAPPDLSLRGHRGKLHMSNTPVTPSKAEASLSLLSLSSQGRTSDSNSDPNPLLATATTAAMNAPASRDDDAFKGTEQTTPVRKESVSSEGDTTSMMVDVIAAQVAAAKNQDQEEALDAKHDKAQKDPEKPKAIVLETKSVTKDAPTEDTAAKETPTESSNVEDLGSTENIMESVVASSTTTATAKIATVMEESNLVGDSEEKKDTPEPLGAPKKSKEAMEEQTTTSPKESLLSGSDNETLDKKIAVAAAAAAAAAAALESTTLDAALKGDTTCSEEKGATPVPEKEKQTVSQAVDVTQKSDHKGATEEAAGVPSEKESAAAAKEIEVPIEGSAVSTNDAGDDVKDSAKMDAPAGAAKKPDADAPKKQVPVDDVNKDDMGASDAPKKRAPVDDVNKDNKGTSKRKRRVAAKSVSPLRTAAKSVPPLGDEGMPKRKKKKGTDGSVSMCLWHIEKKFC